MLFLRVLLFAIISTTSISHATSCPISDEEAILQTTKFIKNLGISFTGTPWILSTDTSSRFDNYVTKEVVFGERGSFKGYVKVDCNNKNIISLLNSEVRDKVLQKYNIPSNTLLPRKWPPFLSDKEAKEKILSYAKKIGIPHDAKFEQNIDIDKSGGSISGHWTRTYNGFPYEKDGIHIEIMAVDGELYSYHKTYYGKPCPTDVKVTKEQAISEGWKEILRLFDEVDWKKHKDDYEVTAKLKIIQPNVLAGRMVGRRSSESRLAWVLYYKYKYSQDRKKLTDISYLRSITIKIDAGTKKFLGGDRSK